MTTDRTIKKAVKAYETLEGGGVMISRALPHRQVAHEDVDPFLLMDEAAIDTKGPGFPQHPHRGFEIITYLLKGSGAHEDNLGNKGRVEAGGFMKLTAGSGMWHGEQAGGEKGGDAGGNAIMHGIQFWVNLPLAEKKRKPEFALLQANEVHEIKGEGSLTRVLVGPGSKIQMVQPMHYLDVTVQPGKEWTWELSNDWQGYCYVLDGTGKFGSNAAEGVDQSLLILGEGGNLRIFNDGKEPLRFMLAAGLPLRQPVLWNGPFVD